jgi:hypothetical protein
MDVMEYVVELRVPLYGHFFRAPLKQCSNAFVPFVKVFCVANVEFADKKRQTALCFFRNQQVVMIFHQTPPVYINQQCPTYDVGHCVLRCRCREIDGKGAAIDVRDWGAVVKHVQSVHKPGTVLIIEDQVSAVYAAVQNMYNIHMIHHTMHVRLTMSDMEAVKNNMSTSRNVIAVVVTVFFVMSIVFFGTAENVQAAWYNSNYQYCRELTMTAGGNSGGVATTTAGGFALVATSTMSSLATTLSGGRITNTTTASGTTTPVDVIITNGTECNSDGGSTVLDFYFEKYASTTGEFVLWVEAPDISSTSAKTALMYYGNASATDQSDEAGTFGALNELLIWNLDEDPGTAGAGGILDSTSNNNDGTDNGSMTTSDSVRGMVGAGMDFDGNDYVSEAGITLGSNFTYLAWTFNSSFTGWDTVVGVTLNRDFALVNGVPVFYDGAERTIGTALSTNTWYNLAAVSNGSSIGAYANGVLQSSPASVSYGGYSGGIAVAAWYDGGAFTDFNIGIIDDVRVYDRALHSMDILTIYNNTRSSTNFWTFGSEETESVAPSDWYDTDYGYCRELTMTAGGNTGGVATTTTSGFALVATSTFSTFAATSSAGRIYETSTASGTTTPVDVIVTNGTDCHDDGGTLALDFYFEKYVSTTGQFVLWVEPKDIASTTQKSVLMYYGYADASATDQSDEAGTFVASGEVAVWNLQEDPGSAGANGILDSTSNNNDGTDNGSMTSSDQVNGYLGGAFDFDNTDDFIDVPSSASLGVADVFTVMLWLKRATGSGHDNIWWFENLKPYAGINGFDSQKVTFGQFNGTDFGQTQTRTLADTSWHHVAWTKNGSAQDVYVDSVEDFASSDNATIGSGNSPFHFGGGDVFPFEGIMDDVRVFNRALHAMDILTIYNNTRSSTVFWTFGNEQQFAGGDGTPARKFRLMGRVRVQGVRLIGL